MRSNNLTNFLSRLGFILQMNKQQSERNKRKSHNVRIVDKHGSQHVERMDGTLVSLTEPKRQDDWHPQDFLMLLLYKRDAENYSVNHKDSSGCVETKIGSTSWSSLTKKLNTKQELKFTFKIKSAQSIISIVNLIIAFTI